MPISGAEVAFHVHTEGFERRNVEDTGLGLGTLGTALGRRRNVLKSRQSIGRGSVQPVQRPEERGQGFSRTGGSYHQGMGTGGNGIPRAILGSRGLTESAEEPFPGCLAETAHGACGRLLLLHSSIMPHGQDIISPARGEAV